MSFPGTAPAEGPDHQMVQRMQQTLDRVDQGVRQAAAACDLEPAGPDLCQGGVWEWTWYVSPDRPGRSMDLTADLDADGCSLSLYGFFDRSRRKVFHSRRYDHDEIASETVQAELEPQLSRVWRALQAD